VVPFVIAGVGISTAVPTMPVAVIGALARPDMGTASGVLNLLQRVRRGRGGGSRLYRVRLQRPPRERRAHCGRLTPPFGVGTFLFG
jgi:hypothetical protein